MSFFGPGVSRVEAPGYPHLSGRRQRTGDAQSVRGFTRDDAHAATLAADNPQRYGNAHMVGFPVLASWVRTSLGRRAPSDRALATTHGSAARPERAGALFRPWLPPAVAHRAGPVCNLPRNARTRDDRPSSLAASSAWRRLLPWRVCTASHALVPRAASSATPSFSSRAAQPRNPSGDDGVRSTSHRDGEF